MSDKLASLARHLRELGPAAIAVSGGVDSMTLAVVAHRAALGQIEMYHAVSAAVPPQATARVRELAAREGWALTVLDAGEFEDSNYVSNPVNRCFFCKTHLYSAIAEHTQGVVLSGTNTDDLGDFRPGLAAATTFHVRHPYVEVGVDKATVREIARELGLEDIAELPAAPCLASRIETGIPIAPETLMVVNRVEREVARMLNPESVRCRVRKDGCAIEIDELTLARVSPREQQEVIDRVRGMWPDPQAAVTVETYTKGSAFLRETSP